MPACTTGYHEGNIVIYYKIMSERIEKIKAFLQASPNDCFLNHALALEYIKSGDEKNAIIHFTLNLTNDPAYVATYYHLAKVYERAGDTDKAVATYEKGMEYARTTKDMHTFSELKSAWEELVY
jgi:predicted Zn-dependent protease